MIENSNGKSKNMKLKSKYFMSYAFDFIICNHKKAWDKVLNLTNLVNLISWNKVLNLIKLNF